MLVTPQWRLKSRMSQHAYADDRVIHTPFTYNSVSQSPGPGINYTGPREILQELITNLNVILYLSTCHTVQTIVLILFMIMP
jgi:hypothetical protein